MSWMKQFLVGFKKGMREFAESIAQIVNTAVLLLVYLVGIGVTSILAKLFGKHFLDMNSSVQRNTYWSDLNLKEGDIDRFYRQF